MVNQNYEITKPYHTMKQLYHVTAHTHLVMLPKTILPDDTITIKTELWQNNIK